MALYLGVDVGTNSVRAALISEAGNLLQHTVVDIKTWCTNGHFEQSSDDIWQAVCKAVRAASSGVSPEAVKGIGFDGTCSLVVLSDDEKPLSASLSADHNRNVILWLDHRAEAQTARINATAHHMLKYVGGQMSPEMEMPKILWIKENLPDTWQLVGHLMDLPDFLTWRATSSRTRSLCSLVCKWAYHARAIDEHGWNDEFLQLIGLGELTSDAHKKIGAIVLEPGQACGSGLSALAAHELGLKEGTAVGTSMIDAHAGGIGMLGCRIPALESLPLSSKLGLICGTSTCHMIVNEQPTFVQGVWGPYLSAMVPQLWLNEGGQSATGKLVDYIIENHAAYGAAIAKATAESTDIYTILASSLMEISQKRGIPLASITRDLHIWPDFHGNRSPLADPSLRGMICGLTLGTDLDDLAALYLAILQSLAYGTRLIVDAMQNSGHMIDAIYICGGLTKSNLFVQTTADVLKLRVVVPDESQSVLLGAAMLGACAASEPPCSLVDVMRKMSCSGRMILPDESVYSYHDRKYSVFNHMIEDQRKYLKIMAE